METSFRLDQILQRYVLPLQNNLLHSYYELHELNIDREFIYELLHSFEADAGFLAANYRKFSLQTIIDYIRRTHRLYLTKKLCEIEQSISILLKDYDGDHPLLLILNRFFLEYQVDLTNHIRYEEAYVLPYIDYLLKVDKGEVALPDFIQTSRKYSLKDFIDNHLDTEDDLSGVRNSILQYEPPITNQTPYRILITQLHMFEKDLGVHALIEEQVLVPRAQELENDLLKRFIQSV